MLESNLCPRADTDSESAVAAMAELRASVFCLLLSFCDQSLATFGP